MAGLPHAHALLAMPLLANGRQRAEPGSLVDIVRIKELTNSTPTTKDTLTTIEANSAPSGVLTSKTLRTRREPSRGGGGGAGALRPALAAGSSSCMRTNGTRCALMTRGGRAPRASQAMSSRN